MQNDVLDLVAHKRYKLTFESKLLPDDYPNKTQLIS